MAKDLVVSSKFTVNDQFTSKFTKMMAVANKQFEKTKSGIGRMNDFIKNNKDSIEKVARNTAIAGGVIFAGLGLAAKSAVDFEKSIAGVAKYANVDVGSDRFRELGDTAKELSVVLGTMPQDTANLMQNLAGGGVAIADLKEVTEIAGKMGVAFDITGDMAGESFVKTKNALNLTIQETAGVMDAINELGNAYAANSDQILDFMAMGGAGVANSLKAGGDAVAAFGSRLISIGETASTSATVMQAFTRTVNKDKDLNKIFEKAGGGAEGMFAVIEHGSKLSGAAQKKYFAKFGNYGLSVQNLASNTDALREAMDLATDSVGRAGSVNKEFDNANSTTGAKLARLKVQFMNIAITIGEQLLPIIEDLVAEISPVIKRISTWMKENPKLVKTLVKVAIGIGVLMVAVSGIASVMLMFSKVVTIASGVMKVFNLVLLANPIGLIVLAVIAAIAVITMIILKFKEWGSAIAFLMGPIGLMINALMLIREYWGSIVDAFQTDGILAGIKRIGVFLLDLVLYPIQQLLGMLAKIPGLGKLAGSGRDIVNDLRKSIGAVNVSGELTSSVKGDAITGDILSALKLPPVDVNSKNKSEVVLKIDDGRSTQTQDITNGGVFSFASMPKMSSTM